MYPFRPRLRRPLAALAALVSVTLAACSDSTAPTFRSGYITAATDAAAPAILDGTTIDFKLLYPKLTTQIPSLSMKGDTTLQKFTVNPPDGKLIKFGKTSGHVIAIPGNTLCDPTRNAYGPTEWLKPCILAKSSISFVVKTWTDAQGRPHADFEPNIRFNPSGDAVKIFFQDLTLANFSNVYIPFCDAANVCLDESLTDSALVTYASPNSAGGYWVHRRLRHFSGYNVTAF
ncbi:MAG TPA: hypothetical protein VFV33_00045 [Gemmatimonadaceae bacterium]|nr:hypothetical protein [Gemmatimonadaceae bacterium]